jgi:hypothetical protein
MNIGGKIMENKIKRNIGVLIILGMLLMIAVSISVTADLDNNIWYRDDTGTDVSLSSSASGYDVGIGTNNPNAKLEVCSNNITQLRLAYDILTYADFSVASTGKLTIQTSSTNGTIEDIEIRTENFDNAIYIDDSTDRVGIGTSSPGGPLHVYSAGGTGTYTLIIEQNNVGDADAVMLFKNEGGELSRITADESNDELVLASAVGSDITIENSNQVGIMERNPITTLDVNGGLATQITLVTASTYTATNSDFTILVDPAPLGTTISLPTASGIDGQIYIIKNAFSDGGTDPVFIDPYGSEQIDGISTTSSLSAVGASIQIQAYNGNWYIIGSYP